MAKNSKHAAQRAKKKNEKDKKRKNRVVAQRRTEAQRTAAEAAARSTQKAREDVLRDWKPEMEGIHGLSMRSERNLYETARSLEHLAHHGTVLPDYLWTPARVRALSDEDIVAKLGATGIATDRERFREESKPDSTALKLWERAWEPGLADTTPVRELDFAALAACVLWERWQPERPSGEMLLDLLIDSDEAEHHEDYVLAVEKSLLLWERLRGLLPAPRTLAQIQSAIHVSWDFSMFAEDIADYAQEAREKQPAIAARAAGALSQMLAEVSDLDEATRTKWQEEVAELTGS